MFVVKKRFDDLTHRIEELEKKITEMQEDYQKGIEEMRSLSKERERAVKIPTTEQILDEWLNGSREEIDGD